MKISSENTNKVRPDVADKYRVNGWNVFKFDADAKILFRLWKCLTISADINEYADKGIEVHWENRNVVLRVNKENAVKYKPKPLFGRPNDDRRLHYIPLRNWEYVSGDSDWLSKLNKDYGWI